jgi:hypothetical protein
MNQEASNVSNHHQIAAMEKFLILNGVSPAEAKKAATPLCGAFDFATKGTLVPIKKDIKYYAREGYVKAAEGEPGGEGDPIKCCILEICC